MDYQRFISIIKQFPPVWDRNCIAFRDSGMRNEAWEKIAKITNCPVTVCQDAYKSLREKYIREREKQLISPDSYTPWQHLNDLSFLQAHITVKKEAPIIEAEIDLTIEPAAPSQSTTFDDPNSLQYIDHSSEFDKALIALVKHATPIWDRKTNGSPNKHVKHQLWKHIAQVLKKDATICMSRWKGLREKYIRQKHKYQEGDTKWEFLDDLSFLDKVIQYRRKTAEDEYPSPVDRYAPLQMPVYGSFSHQFNNHSVGTSEQFDDSSLNDSVDYPVSTLKKEETFVDCIESSYDSGTSSGRKRSASDHSEESSVSQVNNKQSKSEQEITTSSCKQEPQTQSMLEKTPEQMFGELVACMLARKCERDKNCAMIEILKVLSK